MLIALWALNIVLALAFLGAGAMKLLRSKSELRKAGMAWTENVSATNVKLIGAVEVIGAVGLIVPMGTDIVPVLTPVAATCLVAVMIGAVVTHLRRNERSYTAPLALALIAAASAIIGFLYYL